jgi:protein TonB
MRQKLEADRRRLEEQVAQARAAAEAPPPAEAPPLAAAPPPQEEAAPSEPAASEPAPSESAPPPASESVPPPASEPAPVEPSAPPPSEAASAEPAPPPAPVESPAPAVTVGELVRGGPGVRPPVLVTALKPGYPPIAQRMRVEGVVTVEVLVDEHGTVRDSRLVKRVAQDVGLNEAALAAAQKARFKPATKEGVPVKMWYTLTFPFQL